jgi:hypothetical protein
VVVQPIDGEVVAGGDGGNRVAQLVIDLSDGVDIRGRLAEPVPRKERPSDDHDRVRVR